MMFFCLKFAPASTGTLFKIVGVSLWVHQLLKIPLWKVNIDNPMEIQPLFFGVWSKS